MKLFVVGQYNVEKTNWAFFGVFSREKHAVRACTTDRHFVGPCTLDQVVPDEGDEPWPGLYYPLAGETSTDDGDAAKTKGKGKGGKGKK